MVMKVKGYQFDYRRHALDFFSFFFFSYLTARTIYIRFVISFVSWINIIIVDLNQASPGL